MNQPPPAPGMQPPPVPREAVAQPLPYAQSSGLLADWPGLLGGIILLLGVISLLSVLRGVVSAVLMATVGLSSGAWISAAVQTPLGFLPGLLAIIAGILLVRRRRASRVMALIYAWVAAATAVIGGIAFAVASVFQSRGASMPGWVVGQQISHSVFNILSGVAIPIFLIVWLGRAKIRDQVRQW